MSDPRIRRASEWLKTLSKEEKIWLLVRAGEMTQEQADRAIENLKRKENGDG